MIYDGHAAAPDLCQRLWQAGSRVPAFRTAGKDGCLP